MKLLTCFVLIPLAGAATWWSMATVPTQTAEVAPEKLLPATSVVMFRYDGTEAHQPAIQETAAWKALEETGLRTRLVELIQMFASAAGPDAGKTVRNALDGLQNGVSFAFAVSADGKSVAPYGTLVLHEAAGLRAEIEALLKKADPRMASQIQSRTVEGRAVGVLVPPNFPGEIAWWEEGGHLVIVAGINPVKQTLAAASDDVSNVTQHRLWPQLRNNDSFTVDSLGWIDTQSVLEQFGQQPLPNTPSDRQVTVNDIAKILGLAELQGVTFQSGYEDTETWQVVEVIAPGELTGVLSLLKQRTISLDELPPMPPNCDSFFASSFNIRDAVDTTLSVIEGMVNTVGRPSDARDFEADMARFSDTIGGDPRDVFSAGLGDLFCVYSDPATMPIPVGFSPVVAASVEDRSQVEATVKRLVELAKAEAGDNRLSVREAQKDGNTYFSFTIPGAPIVPTVLVNDDWFVASLMPGSAQSFVQRMAGDLPKWEPSESVQQALVELPGEYTSISMSDPAPTYRQMLTFAPMAMGLVETQVVPSIIRQTGRPMMEMPFGVADLPPVEAVTAPMFPNVAVSVKTETGVATYARNSVPGMPAGNVGAVATVPVLVALLLPAVQQAREAARRTQSTNHHKQLALAMHNYHDVYGHLPRGTVENPDLQPNERLSWVYSLLPFLDRQALQKVVDAEAGWQAPANKQVAATAVPTLQNPSMDRRGHAPGSMDYVGIAGIGPDAASLPLNDDKAGIFGYDRETRFRDITDGASNTLMFADKSEPNPSWLAGGKATIRGFSQQPYINGPDGIGSPHRGGLNVSAADGSVRFLSENIDPKVLEALATMHGGEAVQLP